MARGSGVPLHRIAEWCFVEQCVDSGCSALVCTIDGRAWVARNNDLWAPRMWGYLTVREVEGRLPTAIFGMDAEVFAGTGINGGRLWLHYNWLPVEDEPTPETPTWPSFVWLREALLGDVDRDGGMLLFAVDGKADNKTAPQDDLDDVGRTCCPTAGRQTLARRLAKPPYKAAQKM